MNGLLRRLTRRRAATADESPPGTPAASEPVDATVVSQEEGPALSEEERAREEELKRRRRDLPAGLDADASSSRPRRAPAAAPSAAASASCRPRASCCCATSAASPTRCTAPGRPHGGHRDIIERKAARLTAIDEELRVHEARSASAAPPAPSCGSPASAAPAPTCGELHGTEAGWCALLRDAADRPRAQAGRGGHRPRDRRPPRRRGRARRRRPGRRGRRAAAAQAADAERAAAAQAAAAPPAEEPTDEHKRALAEYTSRQRPEAEAGKPAEDQPTSDLDRARHLGAPPVSSVETPPPPTPVERRCPRCGAQLSAEQEWCLDCGAAVGTRIAEPRGWRASVAVVGVLLALALIAVVLAVVELARDAEGVQEVAATPTPAPAASVGTPAPSAEGRRRGADALPHRRARARGRHDAAPASPMARGRERLDRRAQLLRHPRGRRAAGRRAGGQGRPDGRRARLGRLRVARPGLVRRLQRHLRRPPQARGRDQAGGGSARRIVPK